MYTAISRSQSEACRNVTKDTRAARLGVGGYEGCVNVASHLWFGQRPPKLTLHCGTRPKNNKAYLQDPKPSRLPSPNSPKLTLAKYFKGQHAPTTP